MDIWTKLKNSNIPIVLYGMGNGAELVLRQLDKIGKKPVGIFASDEFVRGQSFAGYTVESYNSLYDRFPEMIILVCFGSSRPEVLRNIERLSQKHTVLCPDVPVYGDEVFDINFARDHAEEIKTVYDLLGDDLSKSTFEKIIEFKLSGDSSLLKECQYCDDLFSPLSLTDDEYYVDFGAYRGDTVEQFLSAVKGYRGILAVEPSYKTYLKLCEFLRKYPNAQAIHGAVSDFDGESEIAVAGRGSAMKKKGETVATYTPDTLLLDKNVTLIKMDIEGQEAQAISAAQRVITTYKPKMIVSAYHRTPDLIKLPLMVNRLCPEYRIFLRHMPHNLAWDTNYYFI